MRLDVGDAGCHNDGGVFSNSSLIYQVLAIREEVPLPAMSSLTSLHHTRTALFV